MKMIAAFGRYYLADLAVTPALIEMDACASAQRANRDQPDWRTAIEKCERADWLLWLAAKLDMDRKIVALAACACARTALKFVPAGEMRPLRCIETMEAWTRGEATIEQVRDARVNAYAAADAAYAAAYAAADAAYAAYAAADAAAAAYAAAADAADAAAAAADAAADAAARKQAHKDMCVLVLKAIPVNAFLVAIAKRELARERRA